MGKGRCTSRVKSNGIKRFVEEAGILRRLFPELEDATFDKVIAMRPPPVLSGWFLIPRWEKLASTYSEAVERVFNVIEFEWNCKTLSKHRLRISYLRQGAETMRIFQKLGNEQKKHDFLLVPGYFAFYSSGYMARHAQDEYKNSVGLGAFAAGILFLTYLEQHRYEACRIDELWIACLGDKFSPATDDQLPHAPYFCFQSGVSCYFEYLRYIDCNIMSFLPLGAIGLLGQE